MKKKLRLVKKVKYVKFWHEVFSLPRALMVISFVFHYVALWFKDIYISLGFLSLALFWFVLIIIIGRLDADVYWEEE